jgi:hypothetical protein
MGNRCPSYGCVFLNHGSNDNLWCLVTVVWSEWQAPWLQGVGAGSSGAVYISSMLEELASLKVPMKMEQPLLLGRPRPPTSCLARAVAAERVMPPRGCFAAWVSLRSSRMLVLPKLFAVVVAWPSSVTDVALGSTSGSCCRACDAPSRTLYRVGFDGRLGRLSRWIPSAAATSPE